ncbi:TPA: biliverdin-producing heme oxygenase [Neisseria gonorrhoeae]|uniref:biliverdin-producing heme oxygenase n=1 Tax=Neisseria gonorrhoeae TaxID=485 RepID=UPI00064C8B3C|nr:biliverdin-producing heme oxygenase [Neisseria gonorrhoeae]MCC9109080.1 biliverdin-producing heme oxygenase [Neisseria gonorrhoeae]MCF2998730.1 biliverdin-producing heme oxygenase [Neisseria gonorrhoeae]MDO6009520.1 biliverdin-producing heme oxygenase [Neisseria gonorrhoeae]MDO6027352.1 biliverdin-producing heme oxygenase [Neisseria gonorrhoeae]MDO6082395.1 biliverdin-producing heme oxygenase [Neisseria gonorrhoeae]
MSETENQALTFAKRLKADTTAVHDSVDNLVMSVQPFVSKENYIKFLKLQSVFHKAVDHIYKDPELNKAISELEYMARYDAVTQDLKDLGEEPYKFDKELPHETGNKAVGWLYCAEGSNLGAAFLFKHAQKLDYTGEHGARHLAPHPDGRGKHWRAFVEHLNALNLTPEAEAIQGAQEAFAFYKVILRETFGLPEGTEAPEGMMPHRH